MKRQFSMKPIEMNFIQKVSRVTYQRQASLNDSRASSKAGQSISEQNYSRLIDESKVEEEALNENKMSEAEKHEMKMKRGMWIARVQANKMVNIKQCIYGNDQVKKLAGKQVFVTEILIDKNLTLIIPEQMRTRDLN